MMTLKHTWQLASICCLSLGGAFALGGGDNSKPFKHTPSEDKLFELTNAERKKAEAAPLKLSAELSKIARAHSANMARQGKMAHNLDDKTPFDRLRAAGYRYFMAGENVAQGAEKVSLPMLMEKWMGSEGHRKNILQPEYTEIGIGIASDPNGQLYFTQLFAKPRK